MVQIEITNYLIISTCATFFLCTFKHTHHKINYQIFCHKNMWAQVGNTRTTRKILALSKFDFQVDLNPP